MTAAILAGGLKGTSYLYPYTYRRNLAVNSYDIGGRFTSAVKAMGENNDMR